MCVNEERVSCNLYSPTTARRRERTPHMHTCSRAAGRRARGRGGRARNAAVLCNCHLYIDEDRVELERCRKSEFGIRIVLSRKKKRSERKTEDNVALRSLNSQDAGRPSSGSRLVKIQPVSATGLSEWRCSLCASRATRAQSGLCGVARAGARRERATAGRTTETR